MSPEYTNCHLLKMWVAKVAARESVMKVISWKSKLFFTEIIVLLI